ncbi:MAG: elongation factor G [Clostridiales bacterium]|nr:elongation factor G [Clostridiales bacterium]MBQ3047268.1 elongation factor G [Clostridia bacterium]
MGKILSENIRNVAIIGHSGAGKTSLAEAILFNGKTIDRLGKTTDKNTVMDYDEQEMQRGISISLACASTTWQDTKINIVDVPGFYDFDGEFESAMRAIGSAVLVADANGTLAVGAEKAIDYCLRRHIPLMIFVNGVDKENANYVATVEAFRAKYGRKISPTHLPILRDGKMKGYVSVISGKAFEFSPGGREPIAVPENLVQDAAALKEALTEAAAETSEVLLDKYFAEGTLTNDEIVAGVRSGLTAGETIPIMGGSALQNMGVINLMYEIVDLLPSPFERRPVLASDEKGEILSIVCDVDKPFSAQVFKTVADPFVGKLNMIRVFTGTLKSGMTVYNSTTGEKERINSIYIMKGKKQEPVEELTAGDIGAVNKLVNTNTSNTLCDESFKIKYYDIAFPVPVLTMAISAAKSGEEDKVFQGLNRLAEEDLTFKVEKDKETGEMVIRGQGETQLDIICKKLKSKFGCEAVLRDPKVAFKETIMGSAEAEGKHKKQTGGAGQYGVVNIKFESGAADGEFEFVDAVVGGAVPKQFIPAVEKGLKEAITKGVLAGYPVVNLKCTLFDGKYHPVDSKEVAFVSAAKLAYDDGMRRAKPVILEPVYSYKITVPDNFTGDILGDMNKRRGRILGMETVDGLQEISAEAPLAEMLKYAIDLRSMTQGRGKFAAEFLRYEEVPFATQEKIIAEANK